MKITAQFMNYDELPWICEQFLNLLAKAERLGIERCRNVLWRKQRGLCESGEPRVPDQNGWLADQITTIFPQALTLAVPK